MDKRVVASSTATERIAPSVPSPRRNEYTVVFVCDGRVLLVVVVVVLVLLLLLLLLVVVVVVVE